MTVPTLEEFLAEATSFLDQHARPKGEAELVWGEGSDRVSIFPERTPEEDAADLAAAAGWRRTLFDGGYGWIDGPEAYGGKGLPADYARAFTALERGYDHPATTVFAITYGMITTTTNLFGTPAAKDRYLRALYRGDLLGCQLFSEPESGSDVAALATRAERDGDEWVVNGQKVWTSGAHLADVGLVLVRTNHDVAKHKGLTMFLIDMRQPGVEVRPLRQMTGGASFNEVFFTDARIPDELRLGAVDEGWNVTLATLLNERAAAAEANQLSPIAHLRLLAEHLDAANDPVLRQQLADVFIHSRVAGLTSERAMAKLKSGQLPGPEMSIGKLALTNNLTRMAALVSTLLGPKLIADTGEWGTYGWSELVLSAPGLRLGGGTDEIQKNIIGEHVLGLPREPKPAP